MSIGNLTAMEVWDILLGLWALVFISMALAAFHLIWDTWGKP